MFLHTRQGLSCMARLSSSAAAAKQFACVPTLSSRDLLTFISPYNERRLKPIFSDLFSKYGDIFKLKVPGSRYQQVFICNPEDVRSLLQADGSMPIAAGFDFFVAYRKRVNRDLGLRSLGLVGAHGAKWYEVRSLVQQDMMRPKSAMFYIDSIEKISEQLNDVIENLVDTKSREVNDITEVCYGLWSQ